LLFALVFYAPARWLAGALNQASAGQLQLVAVRGTVWTGSARLQLSGGAGSLETALLPGVVDWTLRPGWGALNLKLSADCCTAAPLHATLLVGLRGAALQVADGRSQWPADMLSGLGTPWNTVQADGSLALLTQGLKIEWFAGRLAFAGRVELTALALSSRLSTLKPMGSYRLVLTGGSEPVLTLSTLEGSLQLSGSGSWVGSRLRFNGEASALPEHEAALANLLNIIGRRNGLRSIITLG
jgi:general secretion pathway protein N